MLLDCAALFVLFAEQNLTPHLATLYASNREMATYTFKPVAFETFPVRTSYTRKPLSLRLIRSSRPKAPLALIFPPLFDQPSHHQIDRYAEYFAKRGYHVIALPNPFSKPFAAALPTYFPGDMPTEVKLYDEMIRRGVSMIGDSRIQGVTLLGMSYGAMLGAMYLHHDLARDRTLIDGPSVFIGPPLSIPSALKEVDSSVSRARSPGVRSCVGMACLIAKTFLFSNTDQLTARESTAEDFLSIVGFRGGFRMVLAHLNESLSLNLSRAEIRAMTFEEYAQRFVPAASELVFGKWIGKIRELRYENLVVLTSQDDPLNAGLKIEEELPLSANQLLVLPSGGHLGYRVAKTVPDPKRDWMDLFLNAIYSPAEERDAI